MLAALIGFIVGVLLFQTGYYFGWRKGFSACRNCVTQAYAQLYPEATTTEEARMN